MNNKNFKLQELKRWLKTSLKNKISINEKTEIECMLNKFSIPYEYDDIEKCFIIFGYR